jgi:hypothetical protein
MKKLLLFTVIAMALTGCEYKTIKGNGNVTTEVRKNLSVNKIKLMGSYDVELIPGSTPSVSIDADENILPYIITENRNGVLEIKSKNHFNLSSTHAIKVSIVTDKLESVVLSGSGNVVGKGKFTGADKLNISILGSGDINIETNTPKVDSHIAGSGTITLKGETKDATINIAGGGEYKGDELKAENVKISITGSGDVRVFADATLDVHITGGGDIYYKGNPAITQHIVGGGSIKQLP